MFCPPPPSAANRRPQPARRHTGRLVLTLTLVLGFLANSATAAPPNILFIAVDDLNDWVGCLGGHPQARTPNLDRLAARGTVFLNAHCQSPLCNPSRTSVLTGLRPSTTGIYGLAPGFRSVASLRTRITLPQHLAAQGYHTATFGKIFHDGSIAPAGRTNEVHVWGPAPGMPRPARKFVTTPDPNPLVDWGVFPARDEDQADWQIASAAIAHLNARPTNQPFFIAAGFRLPHVPCYASQRWFDLYPLDSLQLPPVLPGDRSDLPAFASYLHWRLPEPRLAWLQSTDQWRPLVRAYLAGISFMDSQVGRLLDALDARGGASNTVVVLWSDHGWHLGEKGITGKNTLWERSTRVPLLFAGPGITAGGRVTQPAELLDLFPTLAALAGTTNPPPLEGHSLVAQLRDPAAPRTWPAITTHNHDNHAVRTARWRYIRYADGSEELYDVAADPNEWRNLAGDPTRRETCRELARWLPARSAPPVPGSAHRILVYTNGTAVWEGKVIPPGAPLPD